MRELVHYGIVHDVSDIFRSRESKQDAKKVERFHDVLGDYYTTLTGKLLDYHGENPFHRTYIEGYFDGELGDGPAIYIPARALHDLYNIPIMPTEHNGLRILALIYEERIIDEMKKGKKIPIRKFLESFSDGGEIFLPFIKNFFKDCEYADINQAREYWIGRNIASTLQENERGILFLGKGHNPENVKKYLTSNTKYTYKDLFPEIN
ncbi:MAG TPA: hypothetical protein HA360_03740 [Nanoarchaeota archaeon]|nr:hypothetical protein [Candidatus Woesearchaeota archaeon]HIH14650.1 hypothetical protein [Nanoarchaeota archaeon]HIH59162.1 hypothetical protein [Nanoarchaeota archaeon]HII14160.1 hypothetical protein [Nanoarchaeota archaeon]HIJ05611.1 hypothetical protein [Nanoarchaeota archaeon]